MDLGRSMASTPPSSGNSSSSCSTIAGHPRGSARRRSRNPEGGEGGDGGGLQADSLLEAGLPTAARRSWNRRRGLLAPGRHGRPRRRRLQRGQQARRASSRSTPAPRAGRETLHPLRGRGRDHRGWIARTCGLPTGELDEIEKLVGRNGLLRHSATPIRAEDGQMTLEDTWVPETPTVACTFSERSAIVRAGPPRDVRSDPGLGPEGEQVVLAVPVPKVVLDHAIGEVLAAENSRARGSPSASSRDTDNSFRTISPAIPGSLGLARGCIRRAHGAGRRFPRPRLPSPLRAVADAVVGDPPPASASISPLSVLRPRPPRSSRRERRPAARPRRLHSPRLGPVLGRRGRHHRAEQVVHLERWAQISPRSHLRRPHRDIDLHRPGLIERMLNLSGPPSFVKVSDLPAVDRRVEDHGDHLEHLGAVVPDAGAPSPTVTWRISSSFG